jgi:DNA-binding MarR family transcriptional regulator
MGEKRSIEPLVRVGDDFEDEYPGADALATECLANVIRTGDLLSELVSRQILDICQLSQSALQVLAVIDGAGQPLEPSVIAQRRLLTTGSMTSLLDNLEKRSLIERLPHPDDRRKLLIDITPEGEAIVDAVLPAVHARERELIDAALTPTERRTLLGILAKLQHAARETDPLPAPSPATRRRPNRARTPQPNTQGARS